MTDRIRRRENVQDFGRFRTTPKLPPTTRARGNFCRKLEMRSHRKHYLRRVKPWYHRARKHGLLKWPATHLCIAPISPLMHLSRSPKRH